MRRFPFLAGVLVIALAAFAARCASAPESAPLPEAGFAIDPAAADTVVFAGGCFWCMEKPFEILPGVASVISGFSGGTVPNPTYDQVSTKTTGHYEVVQIIYDPAQVSYETLLRTFWHNIDPFQADGQFCDRGSPYRSAVFVGSADERAQATATRDAIATRFQLPVVTEILPEAPFYAAEDYHQDFYRTNPGRYQSYRSGCGRDRRLNAIWGEAAGHTGDAL